MSEEIEELLTITNKMKSDCIGEFSFEIDEACSACSFHGSQEECEVCGGEIEFTRVVTVPWDICKDIYKAMLKSRCN